MLRKTLKISSPLALISGGSAKITWSVNGIPEMSYQLRLQPQASSWTAVPPYGVRKHAPFKLLKG